MRGGVGCERREGGGECEDGVGERLYLCYVDVMWHMGFEVNVRFLIWGVFRRVAAKKIDYSVRKRAEKL